MVTEESYLVLNGIADVMKNMFKLGVNLVSTDNGTGALYKNSMFEFIVMMGVDLDIPIIMIEHLEVYREFRNNNLGSSILYIICKVADYYKLNLTLWVKKDNIMAYEWYKKFGFTETQIKINEVRLLRNSDSKIKYENKMLDSYIIKVLEMIKNSGKEEHLRNHARKEIKETKINEIK